MRVCWAVTLLVLVQPSPASCATCTSTSVVPRVLALAHRHLRKSPSVRQPFAEISGSISFSPPVFPFPETVPNFVCHFKGSLHEVNWTAICSALIFQTEQIERLAYVMETLRTQAATAASTWRWTTAHRERPEGDCSAEAPSLRTPGNHRGLYRGPQLDRSRNGEGAEEQSPSPDRKPW